MRPLDPRLLRHVAAVRRHVLLCAGLGVATAGLVLVQADLLAGLVARAFLGGEGLATLGGVLVALLAVVAGRALLAGASEGAGVRAAARVVATLRARLVATAVELGPRHPALPPAGELATLATRGVDGLDGYVRRYLPTLFVAAVVPLVVGVRILSADWTSAVVIALTVGLVPLFMILVGRVTEHSVRRRWRTLAVLGHHFLDLVAGLDVLVAFGRAGAQAARLRENAERHRRATLATLRVAFLSALVLELVATLSVALVAVGVGLRLLAGELDLHTALLVIVLAPEVYLPLRAVGARFHDSLDGLTAADEVLAVLDLPAGSPNPDAARRPAPDPRRVPVRLRNVRVDGRGASPVLHGVSLHLAPGEVLGVVGPSGAGKSTLLDLLLGARLPDAGRVEVGGADLAGLDLASWRARVAWVPQRPVLLAGTVADNLRLGAPGADDTRLAAAARTAALDVALDAPVGEGGAGLSTGQRRRVALARALVADRALLLLDEPTEGVDADTEAAVLAALPAALAGRSAVVVTHRPAVLALCDRVVRLDPPPRCAATPDPATVPPQRPAPAGATPGAGTATGRVPLAGDSARAGRPGSVRALGRAVAAHPGRWLATVVLGSAALAAGVALTATSAWLISSAATGPPVLTLMVAIVAVRAFGLAKGVLRYGERLVGHDAALRLGADLRVRVWEALVRLGPAVTAGRRRGDLLSRLVGDVEATEAVLVRGVLPFATAAVVSLGAVAAFAVLLPAAALALAAGLLVAGAVAPALTALTVRASARRTAAARGEVVAGTVETLDAAAELVAFGAARDRARVLAGADARLTALLCRTARWAGVGSAVGVLALGATTVATAALGITALRAGDLAGTTLAVLTLTPLALAEAVGPLPEAATRIAEGLPAVARRVALEAEPAPLVGPVDASRADQTPAPGVTAPAVVAEELAVRWPGADRDAVHGVDLRLAPGEHLVLTGPSGAGKSTVVAALAATLPVRAGRLALDGVGVGDLPGDAVRARQAWCGPAAHLFDSTLRENLRLARPDASDADLHRALRGARLGDWVATLPDGLDTAVGTHGGTVSGGERQRLGIARALLADQPLLVLDEPAAHLDAATARELCADLLAAGGDRTMLLVSHRPDEFPGVPEVRVGARDAVGAPVAG